MSRTSPDGFNSQSHDRQPGSRGLDYLPRAVKLIITDVDGTLASFWDYFAPAMREYIVYLRDKLGDDGVVFAKEIGHVMHKRGTHEHPWALEETQFARRFAHDPLQFRHEFVDPFWTLLDQNRYNYLRAFPGVIETLKGLKQLGLKIVALSDAPEHMAIARNKQLFNGLLDAVYALENVAPSSDELFHPEAVPFGYERIQHLRNEASDAATKLIAIPKVFEKPNPSGIDRILNDFDVCPDEVLMIGDSLAKDGMVAAARSIRFIWAHYGVHLPAEYDMLVNGLLRPEDALPLVDAASDDSPKPVAVAARFEEIGRHLLAS